MFGEGPCCRQSCTHCGTSGCPPATARPAAGQDKLGSRVTDAKPLAYKQTHKHTPHTCASSYPTLTQRQTECTPCTARDLVVCGSSAEHIFSAFIEAFSVQSLAAVAPKHLSQNMPKKSTPRDSDLSRFDDSDEDATIPVVSAAVPAKKQSKVCCVGAFLLGT